MRNDLYTPGTSVIDITAPGGIAALLEFHRATFGDARMDASAVGGDEGAAAAAVAAATVAAEAARAAEATETGYPKDTPVKEMTTEQQVAYWKHQSRKHEDRANRAADYDAVVAERDQLKQATLSDAEKAIEAARKEAADAARKETLPTLVTAEFKVAAAGKIPADRLATLLAPLDLTKFLAADGAEVDTDKVQQYVDGLAPDGKKWPDMGQGRRGDAQKTTGVGAGRSLYGDRRTGKTK